MSPAKISKIFISYSHDDKDLALDRVMPCLEAGKIEPIVDVKYFKGGASVVGQMDHYQDKAQKQLLLISKSYLASDMCKHEMERALAMDPDFTRGVASGDPLVLPVLVGDIERTDLPPEIARHNPLCFDLRNKHSQAKRNAKFDKLIKQAGADLGTSTCAWLEARDKAREFIRNGDSVNLCVGKNSAVAWQALMKDLCSPYDPKGELPAFENSFDLEAHWTTAEIMGMIMGKTRPESSNTDMSEFNCFLESRALRPCRVNFSHFHLISELDKKGWTKDFLDNLTSLVKKDILCLVIESREPMDAILLKTDPRFIPISSFAAQCKEVSL